MFVASRRRDRAISLAQRYGGSSVPFDELPEALERADIVVAATASPHLLLEADELAEVMRARDSRPLLLIDLAVPRDIDAAARQLDGVSLSTSTTSRRWSQRNRQRPPSRGDRKAEGIIEEEIQHFATWLGSLEVLPTVAALRARADADRRRGGGRERRQVGVRFAARPRAVDAIARAIVNRLLHEPTLKMKEMRDDRVHARMALVRDLFGLDAETETPRHGRPNSRRRRRSSTLARRRSRARAAGSRLN